MILLLILFGYCLISYIFVIWANIQVLKYADDGSMNLLLGIITTTLLAPIFAPIMLGLMIAQVVNTVWKGLWI